MTTKTKARTTRSVLGALAALSLLAGLATPAAAGGGWGSVGGGDFRATASPARSGEEIPTNNPGEATRPIVIPQ